MNKAERIYQEFLQEKVGVWYISDGYGAKIMIKAPSSTLKALIKGCKLELVFGIDENIFHVGAKIYDDSIHFLAITNVQKDIDEHLSIAKIMNLNEVQIQLCNELSICQAFGDIVLNEKNKNDVLCLLGNPKRLYSGKINDKLLLSSDNFQFSLNLDISINTDYLKKIETISIKTKIENIEIVDNRFIGETEVISTDITNSDEGKLLEKEIFIALKSLFEEDICLSPQIKDNKNISRELTDIFSFSESGIFLIESKALGVTSVNDERTMARKVKGLQNQIEKGIKQLVGASKKIAKNEPIYTVSGQKIQFNQSLIPYGIILVSELLPFGEWDEILDMLLKTMSNNKIILHIMDLNELMQFIGYSNGDKKRFDYFLHKRFENFVESPSIFQQTKFIKKP
ncbi:hypothetical protein BAX97_11180 [Elizabethkingia meningoseptica]|uniref:hypothetical protein n=1 Tax=Elizabethkingia meningoseptica TaxID=238 RepID=UPI00099A617B|nr:hypothetical protein [Elizabethkingia meningoseptica]OPC35443.1 hypothetical protein BAX97_11180 [Elizabethkingia meningoseptica]